MSVNYGVTESKAQSVEQRTTIDNDPTSTDASKPVTGTDVNFKRGQDAVIINSAANPIPVTGTIDVEVSNDEIGATRKSSTVVIDGTIRVIGEAYTKLATRNFIMIQPEGGDIYIGDSSVTTANGLLLKDGETMELKVEAAQEMYAVSAGSITCRLFEATLT